MIMHDDGSLEIRCPLKYPKSEIDRFVSDKAGWIERKRLENKHLITVSPLNGKDKINAEQVIRNRFEQLLDRLQLPKPTALRIKDQRSRWGSCSSRGRIALNCRCACLPPKLMDYVILHELCHLRHLNHGPDFWSMLETLMPDCRIQAKTLTRYRLCQGDEA